MDFKNRQAELLASKNPFAFIVLAQLAVIKTNRDQPQRLISKLELLRFLFKRGWDAKKRYNICLFLDNLLNLNEELDNQYIAEVKQLEEKEDVKLITTQERYGMRQGIQQGIQQGSAKLLTILLKAKFSMLPNAYEEKIQHADPKLLTKWTVNSVTANSLEEIFEQL